MSKRRIELQERDYRLLTYLVEFGYLTLRQIEEKVLKCSRPKAVRRLNKLIEFKLVGLVWRRDGIGTRVFVPILKNLLVVLPRDLVERAKLCRADKAVFRLWGQALKRAISKNGRKVIRAASLLD